MSSSSSTRKRPASRGGSHQGSKRLKINSAAEEKVWMTLVWEGSFNKFCYPFNVSPQWTIAALTRILATLISADNDVHDVDWRPIHFYKLRTPVSWKEIEEAGEDPPAIDRTNEPLPESSTIAEAFENLGKDSPGAGGLIEYVYTIPEESDLFLTWGETDSVLFHRTDHTIDQMKKRHGRAIRMAGRSKISPSEVGKDIRALWEQAPFWDCRSVGGITYESAPIEAFEPAFGTISAAYVRSISESPHALLGQVPEAHYILKIVHEIADLTAYSDQDEVEINEELILKLGWVGQTVFKAMKCEIKGLEASGSMQLVYDDLSDSNGCVLAKGVIPVVCMGFKRSIGNATGDPVLQSAVYLRKAFIMFGKSALEATACPSVIIGMIGTQMKIAGLLLTDRWILQELTPWMEFGGVSGATDLQKIRVAYVLAEAYRAAAGFARLYESHSEAAPGQATPPNIFFPKHDEITLRGEWTRARLVYRDVMGCYGLAESRALFEADLVGHGPVVVKFTPTYNAEAHRLLAGHGCAPTLYSCERISPTMFMVVMARGGDHAREVYIEYFKRVQDDVKKAIQLLHDAGYVFGDLRPPNVLLKESEQTQDVTGAMLVDFDWCGKANEAFYLETPHPDHFWRPGVCLGAKMQFDDDDHLFKEMVPERST